MAVTGRPAPSRATDYSWTNANGGAFRESRFWQPCELFGSCNGPGGAFDTANFDLGVIPRNRYTVTDVNGENAQLLIHTDSVLFELTDYTLSNTGTDDPSLVVGAAAGESGNVTLMQSPSASFVSLITEVTSIGHVDGSAGLVRVDGPDWQSNGELFVGRDGTGTLTIRPDSEVRVYNESQVYLGYSPSGSGTVNVEGGGLGNDLATVRALVVGRFGDGVLDVRLGGRYRGDFVYLAFGAGATATGRVRDEGSQMTVQRLYVGGSASLAGGEASMTISNGGSVQVFQFGSFSQDDGTVKIWDQGHVTLDGGSLTARQVVKLGTFDWISGMLRSQYVAVSPPAKFLYPPPLLGEELILDQGKYLRLDLFSDGLLSIFNGGRVSLEGGILQVSEVDVSDGTFDYSSGQLNIMAKDLIVDDDGVLGSDRTISGDSELSIGLVFYSLPASNHPFPIRGREVRVGDDNAGTLRILDGAHSYVGDTYVGYASGATGMLIVDGVGSKWVSEHQSDGTTTVIGRAGSGTMIVSGGAVVEETDDMPNPLLIGAMLGAEGTLTLTGAGSRWDPTSLTIGNFGRARISVRDGAMLTSSALGVAIEPESNVTIEVDGVDSLFDVSTAMEPVSLGKRGVVSLDVTGGAMFKSESVIVADGGSSQVSVSVEGAGSQWMNAGALEVAHTGEGALTITAGGRVSSAFAYIGVNPLASGMVTVTGLDSMWTNVSDVFVGAGVDGAGGEGTLVLGAGGGVAAEEVHVWSTGTLSGEGTVEANVVNEGVTTPGDPAGVLNVDGHFDQQPGGTLAIQIAGTVAGLTHGRLVVTGAATLAGVLDVVLAAEFAPNVGDSFTVVQAGKLTGRFDQMRLAELPPDRFWNTEVDQLGGTVVLRVCGQRGDIDRDCAVTLADVAGFVDCMAGPDLLPDPAPPVMPEDCLAAFDVDGTGHVDLADYAAFAPLASPD